MKKLNVKNKMFIAIFIIIIITIFMFLLIESKKKYNVPVKEYDNPIFRISTVRDSDECVDVSLEFYRNGKYQFFHTHHPSYMATLGVTYYKWVRADIGSYNIFYNFGKITKNLEIDNIKTDEERKKVKYIIDDIKKNNTYIIKNGEENAELNKLLKSIGVNLDECAKLDNK